MPKMPNALKSTKHKKNIYGILLYCVKNENKKQISVYGYKKKHR